MAKNGLFWVVVVQFGNKWSCCPKKLLSIYTQPTVLKNAKMRQEILIEYSDIS